MAADPLDLTDQRPAAPGDFVRDTAVRPDDEVPGRFHADLPEAWKVFYAFGGATMAVALRGTQRALDRDDLRPVTATALFASPVSCGPLVVDTNVIRNGKGVAQATADLRNATSESTDVHLSSIFGGNNETHVVYNDLVFPEDAVPVADAPVPPSPPGDSPFSRINYQEQTEFRAGSTRGSLFDGNWQPGPARSLTWHRLNTAPTLADGTIDPLSYCMAADALGMAIWAKLGPPSEEKPFFLILSLEITVQFVASTTSPWILQHVQVPIVQDGYGYSYVELWSEDHQLLALANQRCYVRPVPPTRFPAPDGTA